MLLDKLATFKRAGIVSKCFVISSDLNALREAEKLGANGIPEPRDMGVNSAVSYGRDRLSDKDEFMVVPADLPLLRKQEITAALSLGKLFDCVISPSRYFNGTNLLIFSRRKAVGLSYDANSFWNHIKEGARRRLTLAVYTGAGVLFDVDTVDDLNELARAPINRRSVQFAERALARWAS